MGDRESPSYAPAARRRSPLAPPFVIATELPSHSKSASAACRSITAPVGPSKVFTYPPSAAHRGSSVQWERHDGELVDRGALPTTALGLARLRDEHGLPPGTPIALETGTSAFFVARELARLDLAPVVIDAHEVRRKAHRSLLQKSDRRDALELCEGLSRGFYRSVVHVLQHQDCDDRHKLGSQDAPRPAQQ